MATISDVKKSIGNKDFAETLIDHLWAEHQGCEFLDPHDYYPDNASFGEPIEVTEYSVTLDFYYTAKYPTPCCDYSRDVSRTCRIIATVVPDLSELQIRVTEPDWGDMEVDRDYA